MCNLNKINISTLIVKFGGNLQDKHQPCKFLQVKHLTSKFLQIKHLACKFVQVNYPS